MIRGLHYKTLRIAEKEKLKWLFSRKYFSEKRAIAIVEISP